MTVSVNLGFFVFNMLPVPPLDGSRLLYALAPESARRLMEQIEQYGTLVVFLLVVLFSGAIGRVMSACISKMCIRDRAIEDSNLSPLQRQ